MYKSTLYEILLEPESLQDTTINMIEFENVGLRYGSHPEIISDASFSLPKGSFHYITGPSGAGKTSLIRLLSLIQKPSRGQIRIDGQVITHNNRHSLIPFRRKIGVVYQSSRLLDHLTVFENVALPLRIKGAPSKEIQQNVSELLKWVGLGDRMEFYPETLSGGEKQRVSIARAVISQPHLLLADEPTGNLDDNLAIKIMKLFDQLYKMGTTIAIATHDQGLIDKFPHSLLRLHNGHITLEEPGILDFQRARL